MRHGKKFNHLGRTSAHRKAVLRNMGIALIEHKRIFTTLAKAKALRQFVEPLITKGKSNTTHSRRVVFSYLQNKEAVKEIFDVIAAKVGDRPGGYVRIVRTGWRKGDAADMALIEFVDYNETYSAAKKGEGKDSKGGGKKRRRRGGKSAAGAATVAAAATTTKTSGEEE
jgi:large subunit ribosomal protein L17